MRFFVFAGLLAAQVVMTIPLYAGRRTECRSVQSVAQRLLDEVVEDNYEAAAYLLATATETDWVDIQALSDAILSNSIGNVRIARLLIRNGLRYSESMVDQLFATYGAQYLIIADYAEDEEELSNRRLLLRVWLSEILGAVFGEHGQHVVSSQEANARATEAVQRARAAGGSEEESDLSSSDSSSSSDSAIRLGVVQRLSF